jgi:hypothetical protein
MCTSPPVVASEVWVECQAQDQVYGIGYLISVRGVGAKDDGQNREFLSVLAGIKPLSDVGNEQTLFMSVTENVFVFFKVARINFSLFQFLWSASCRRFVSANMSIMVISVPV